MITLMLMLMLMMQIAIRITIMLIIQAGPGADAHGFSRTRCTPPVAPPPVFDADIKKAHAHP